MEIDKPFAEMAALLGEPARAVMLWNLLDGRAYTAGELAIVSDVSPQSASNHLKKMIAANILVAEKQGKHRYFRFSRPEVASAIEAMANLIPDKRLNKPADFKNGDIQFARTCYDHLAGKIAVTLTQSLLNKDYLLFRKDHYDVSPKGGRWFESLGIELDQIKKNKRSFAKPCLDWTERKPHLAGALGAAMLNRLFDLDWIRRKQFTRTVILTAKGEVQLYNLSR